MKLNRSRALPKATNMLRCRVIAAWGYLSTIKLLKLNEYHWHRERADIPCHVMQSLHGTESSVVDYGDSPR
jgi:hypothetical protein